MLGMLNAKKSLLKKSYQEYEKRIDYLITTIDDIASRIQTLVIPMTTTKQKKLKKSANETEKNEKIIEELNQDFDEAHQQLLATETLIENTQAEITATNAAIAAELTLTPQEDDGYVEGGYFPAEANGTQNEDTPKNNYYYVLTLTIDNGGIIGVSGSHSF